MLTKSFTLLFYLKKRSRVLYIYNKGHHRQTENQL